MPRQLSNSILPSLTQENCLGITLAQPVAETMQMNYKMRYPHAEKPNITAMSSSRSSLPLSLLYGIADFLQQLASFCFLLEIFFGKGLEVYAGFNLYTICL